MCKIHEYCFAANCLRQVANRPASANNVEEGMQGGNRHSHELKLAVGNQLPHELLRLFGLLPPPPLEERLRFTTRSHQLQLVHT